MIFPDNENHVLIPTRSFAMQELGGIFLISMNVRFLNSVEGDPRSIKVEK